MSTDQQTPDPSTNPEQFVLDKLRNYSTGKDRYARFIDDVIGVDRTYVQDTILRSLNQNKQTIVSAANGVGKSYIAAAGGLAALYCNPDTIVNVTAGNKTTLKTNVWKPARSLFRDSDALPGRTLDGSREIRTQLDDEWFLECVSPRYPDDLEGPHNDHVVYIVEESDKPGITKQHIESVRTTATDDNDRILAIANPPRDETNVVHRLIESDQWNTLKFSSWDSHNVRIDRGLEADDEKIPGLVTTSRIEDDWQEYHSEEWPGLDQAIKWSDPDNPQFRDDLADRWYRRRAGIIPPQSASVHRPFDTETVIEGFDESATISSDQVAPMGLGLDVARMGGDSNALFGVFPYSGGYLIRLLDSWKGVDHNQNEARVRRNMEDSWNCLFAIDANGEGSGLEDDISRWYPNTYRFDAGSEAVADQDYKYKWGEGLDHLGDILPQSTYQNSRLRKELIAASRTVRYETNYYKSREATVSEASPKSDVEEQIGRSPDMMDGAMMASWAAMVEPDTNEVVSPNAVRPH